MYKPNELKEDCIGVYKRFPKLTTYIKNLKNWGVDYSEEKLRLERCANGESFRFSFMSEEACKKAGISFSLKPYTWLSMKGDLSRYSTCKFLESYILCFNNSPHWQNVFQEAAAYDYWSLKMELIHHEMVLKMFNSGECKQKLVSHLRYSGVSLGICIALGWLDYARELRDRISYSLEHDMVNDGYDSFGRRRTQHFLIRLLNSHDNVVDIHSKKGIRCAYDVPLFNDVISRWQSDSSEQLSDSLIALCDRHTHQCRQDSFNNSRYYDFENISLEYYLPIEILAIYKLRAERGLSNPELDHPIMRTPLAELCSNSEPYKSDFLDSLLEFARAECVQI